MDQRFEQAVEIVKKNGKELIGRKGADDVKEKGRADYVTEVDIRVQRLIFEELRKIDPSVQFLGEEKENQEIDRNGNFWILDPVDGTTNLIHDFAHSTISLAYTSEGKVVFGIVYDPFHKECFTAEFGKGAYLNGNLIHVSRSKAMSESLIAIGTSPGNRTYADQTFAKMKQVFDNSQDIRRIGSAALELSYVACGRLDGFYEENLKIWDYAAGALLVEEAGGRTKINGNETLACTPGILQEFECTLEVTEE